MGTYVTCAFACAFNELIMHNTIKRFDYGKRWSLVQISRETIVVFDISENHARVN